MRSGSRRLVVGLGGAVAALWLCCVGPASAQPATEGAAPLWPPIGAQAFTFGEDGRVVPPETQHTDGTRDLTFHGSNGKPSLWVCGLRREWLSSPADDLSLTQPPKQRQLVIAMEVWFDPSGGAGGRGYGHARVELGLVDETGRVTHRCEARTASHQASCISYTEFTLGRLVFTFEHVPDELPKRGYVRADVQPAAGPEWEYEDWDGYNPRPPNVLAPTEK